MTDVRVTRTEAGVYSCQCVRGGVHSTDPAKMLTHMWVHQRAGHTVPQGVWQRLQQAIDDSSSPSQT
jgi:hypothetical protein